MSASVDIYTNKVENVTVVPIQAVTVREKEGLKKKKPNSRMKIMKKLSLWYSPIP